MRICKLLTASGSAKACAKALVLWRKVLAASDPVWPSRYWPERLPLLRGARDAAAGAGDAAAAAEFAAETQELEAILGLDRSQ